MAHKYNLYYAMIFEKEELYHTGMQVVLYRYHHCLSHLLFFKDSKPNSWYNFSLRVPLIAPAIAKATLYYTDSILLAKVDRFG